MQITLAKMLHQKVQRHLDGTIERWRDVMDYTGFYRVSDLGRVKSVSRLVCHWRGGLRPVRGRILSTPGKRNQKMPYALVSLSKNNKIKVISVQYLVLLAFVGPRPSPQHKALHKDDNPRNNKLSNLYWGTQKQNGQDAIRNGRNLPGEKNGNSKLIETEVLKIRELYATGEWTQQALADKFRVFWLTIFDVIHRRTWKHI